MEEIVWVRGADAHEELPPIGIRISYIETDYLDRRVRRWFLSEEREEFEWAKERLMEQHRLLAMAEA